MQKPPVSKSFYTHYPSHPPLYVCVHNFHNSTNIKNWIERIDCSFISLFPKTYKCPLVCNTEVRSILALSLLIFDLWVALILTYTTNLTDLRLRALTINAVGLLTVEVRGDGVPCQEAVDGNLIDDVEQHEGHTGEAEGLQQTPCVAWRRRTATVSSPPPPLSLRISTCYYCHSCTETQKKPLCWLFVINT